MITATRTDTGWGRFRAGFQAELLDRIPEHLERLSWSAERIESAQRDGLRRLLAHAVAHSPFHRQRLAGTDVASIEPAGLASLPVMTKTDMMAAIDDVFTDRRLTLAAIEQALAATGDQPVPVLGRYMALATGGSTGRTWCTGRCWGPWSAFSGCWWSTTRARFRYGWRRCRR